MLAEEATERERKHLAQQIANRVLKNITGTVTC